MSGQLWFTVIPLGPILRRLGSLLIKDGLPRASDIIVVLSGDPDGNRILRGAELAKEGFASAVVASNGGFTYSRTRSDLAIEFAVQRGYSPELFIPTNWNAHSTAEEALRVIALLRARHVNRAIIVTTSWHTARAARIYRRLAPELTFYFVGSADPHWHNGDWWSNREGRKTFFIEAAKTIADYLRI